MRHSRARLVGGLWLCGLSLAAPCARAQNLAASAGTSSGHAYFESSQTCIACHNGLTTVDGADVSIGSDWRASMMANAARDPYWHAAVRREILDHPEARSAIEDKCSTCHMPMARFEATAAGDSGHVFANLPIGDGDTRHARLAADGVSCSVCHQISDQAFGTSASFTGGFVLDTTRPLGDRAVFGPFEVDSGRTRIMQSASGFRPTEGTHVQQSELCATCHTLFTHALDAQGRELAELPEQMPYLEWRHSAYREEESCQSCHMPQLTEDTPITSVWGEPRAGFSRHVFRGGNFFMLRMLNRYRAELGVTALPQELDAAATRTVSHLQTSAATVSIADLDMSGGRLTFDVTVENLTGHKLPTAYPSRRAWLHVTVRDAADAVVFESGAFDPTGAIAGNDNDLDPGSFEPHYTTIDTPDDVQIYEVVMVDQNDEPTTGLLTGVRYVKDNRVLPRGFDKTTADDDVAVHGNARTDDDFTGGTDRVRYRIDVSRSPAPLRVEAELWYQPIGFRWAKNLAAYDAFETQRFVRYYEDMASTSAIPLAKDAATTDEAGGQTR